MLKTRIYYQLKPLIPRRLQLLLRGILVRRKREQCRDTWPIDESAGKPPAGWSGWPDGKKFALVLTHDVDTAKGHDKCRHLMKLEKDLGFRSCFNFVPRRYVVSPTLRKRLVNDEFEVGVHGLYHDGKYFSSREVFRARAKEINKYLASWGSVGYRSPSMLHNLDWIRDLNIEYDSSTFDTDPFEPQSDGTRTIFPFIVGNSLSKTSYVEIPYTIPQDFTLFCLMKEKNIDIWKRKLDWIVKKGGIALVNTHPDYMSFNQAPIGLEEYPAEYYRDFLNHVKSCYEGQYWHCLPREAAGYYKQHSDSTAHDRQGCLGNVSIPIDHRNQCDDFNRVCVLAYTFYESDSRVMRYAEALAARGDHVDVVALARNGSAPIEIINGVTVHRIQKRAINEKWKFSYLSRLLTFLVRSSLFLTKVHLKQPYDLIHVHSVPDFEVFAALIPKLYGTKVILDIHDIVPEFYASKFKVGKNSFVFRALKLVERWSTAFSDHVIIANHLWEKVITARSVPAEKCTTYLNYPDQDTFNTSLRTRNGDGRFIMLYPGTLNWHQGVDIAVRAFALIKDQIPEADFHIYGEGILTAQLAEIIEKEQLQDRVTLMGIRPIKEIASIMANADLGIVPKRNDSFGGDAFSTKIFEFMALHVPVIVAGTRIDRHYFNDDLVKFFDAGDEQSLAEAMVAMVRDGAHRKRLADNAYSFVGQHSWDNKKHDYLDLVDKLVHGGE